MRTQNTKKACNCGCSIFSDLKTCYVQLGKHLITPNVFAVVSSIGLN